MRIVCIMVLGVVVGWAASGVHWSRDSNADESVSSPRSGWVHFDEIFNVQRVPTVRVDAAQMAKRARL